MQKLKVLIPLLFCSLIVYISCDSGMRSEKEISLLLQTDREFARKSVEVGAAKAFFLYFEEEAIQLPARAEPLFGRDSIFNAMQNVKIDFVLNWEPQSGGVAQSGDLGWTWGKSTFTIRDKKGENVIYGKYLNVWRKQEDGSWKVLIDIGNQSPPEIK